MKTSILSVFLVSLALLPTCGKPDAGPTTVMPNGEPSRVKVQHCLIAFQDAVGFRERGGPPEKARARSRDEAQKLAGEILTKAKAGEDFAKLVEQFTDDSAPGIYGMVNDGAPTHQDFSPRKGMAKAFGDVSFKLKVGEIDTTSYHRDESPFGWHIIKRLE